MSILKTPASVSYLVGSSNRPRGGKEDAADLSFIAVEARLDLTADFIERSGEEK